MPLLDQRITLVQPDAHGRLSGGYLYNARMADQGIWALLDVSPRQLQSQLPAIETEAVIVDSIWLTEEYFGPFRALQRRGVRLGAILHSLPSMIAAAEAGQPRRLAPTDTEWALLAELDFVCVLGPHFRELLAPRGIETTYLPPGIDEAWRQPPMPKKDRCRLVSVGAVTRRKGFLDVARALLSISPRNIEWTVVGSLEVDADYAAEVKRCASQLADDGVTVVFTGQLSPDRVRRRVQRSQLLVMPSYDENHPLVLLEAIAAGVPCVGYRAGAAREMLGDSAARAESRCGVTVPVGDCGALAVVLARLVSDESERWKLALACERSGRELPSWSEAARVAGDRLASLL